jgi:hypothetical protein
VLRRTCDHLCERDVLAAGTLYGPDRLGFCGPDGLHVRHGAAGPSGRRTEDADDTHGWTRSPRAPGACSRPGPRVTSLPPTGDRTGTAGVYTPLDRTRRAALSDCTGWGGLTARARRRPGLEPVEGGDCREPSRARPGPRCAVMGTCRFVRSRPLTQQSFRVAPVYSSPFKT